METAVLHRLKPKNTFDNPETKKDINSRPITKIEKQKHLTQTLNSQKELLQALNKLVEAADIEYNNIENLDQKEPWRKKQLYINNFLKCAQKIKPTIPRIPRITEKFLDEMLVNNPECRLMNELLDIFLKIQNREKLDLIWLFQDENKKRFDIQTICKVFIMVIGSQWREVEDFGRKDSTLPGVKVSQKVNNYTVNTMYSVRFTKDDLIPQNHPSSGIIDGDERDSHVHINISFFHPDGRHKKTKTIHLSIQ